MCIPLFVEWCDCGSFHRIKKPYRHYKVVRVVVTFELPIWKGLVRGIIAAVDCRFYAVEK